jgi:tRNA modification GTPase
LVEARIDFSDEADVPEDLLGPALEIVRGLRDEIAGALAGAARGERLRDGLVVAIAGPPNAGKSTLLNRIAKREVAIVSPMPGTTRDVIEVHLDLDGYPVTLLDTAGIRDSDDPVEQEGVRRARERAAESDLILWVFDACEGDFPANSGGISATLGGVSGTLGAGSGPAPGVGAGSSPTWLLRNKADLLGSKTRNERNNITKTSNIEFSLSASTGLGLAEFLAHLAKYAESYFGAESALLTRKRHQKALEITRNALDRVLRDEAKNQEDIIAEELRLAAQTLGRLTGRVDVEDILDVIFRDFCIGK